MLNTQDRLFMLKNSQEVIGKKLETIRWRMEEEKRIYDKEICIAIRELDDDRIKFLLNEHIKNQKQFKGELEDNDKQLVEWRKEFESLKKDLGL